METAWAVVQGGLGVFFAAIGVPKLARTARFRQEFARYGYPGWVLPLTGAVELLGGAALLAGLARPSLTLPAAAWVAATMVGALITHARLRDPAARFAVPALLLAAAVAIAATRLGA